MCNQLYDVNSGFNSVKYCITLYWLDVKLGHTYIINMHNLTFRIQDSFILAKKYIYSDNITKIRLTGRPLLRQNCVWR